MLRIQPPQRRQHHPDTDNEPKTPATGACGTDAPIGVKRGSCGFLVGARGAFLWRRGHMALGAVATAITFIGLALFMWSFWLIFQN